MTLRRHPHLSKPVPALSIEIDYQERLPFGVAVHIRTGCGHTLQMSGGARCLLLSRARKLKETYKTVRHDATSGNWAPSPLSCW
jgi:hypothetical protein